MVVTIMIKYLKLIINYRFWFLIALFTTAWIMWFELNLAREMGGGYTISLMLHDRNFSGELTYWGFKILIFSLLMFLLFVFKVFLWRKSLSWKMFIILMILLFIQTFIVSCFEVIYLFTGTSLQHLCFAIYFICLIISAILISVNVSKTFYSVKKLIVRMSSIKHKEE